MAKRAVIQKVKELIADTYRRAHASAKKHPFWRDVKFSPGPNHMQRYLKWCERNKLDPTTARNFEVYYGVWSLRAETGSQDKVSIEKVEALIGPGSKPHKLYEIAYRDAHERQYLEGEIEESKWATLTAETEGEIEELNYETKQWEKKTRNFQEFKGMVLVKYEVNVAGCTSFATFTVSHIVRGGYRSNATIEVSPTHDAGLEGVLGDLISFAKKQHYGYSNEKLLNITLKPYVDKVRRRRRRARSR